MVKIPLQEILDDVHGALINSNTKITNEAAARESKDSELQEQIGSQLALLDKDVQTKTEVEATESNLFVSIEFTNIKTGAKLTVQKPVPLASTKQAGVIDKVMYDAFVQMQADISELYGSLQGLPRTAVVAGLRESPTQEEMSDAFEEAKGSEPSENDRLVNVDFNREYIFLSGGEWALLGSTSVGFASSASDGIVRHSEIDGAIGYYAEGIGQLNGYDNLVAGIANISSSLTSLGTQVTTNTNAISAMISITNVSVAATTGVVTVTTSRAPTTRTISELIGGASISGTWSGTGTNSVFTPTTASTILANNNSWKITVS